jgi:hypothetical protein
MESQLYQEQISVSGFVYATPAMSTLTYSFRMGQHIKRRRLWQTCEYEHPEALDYVYIICIITIGILVVRRKIRP